MADSLHNIMAAVLKAMKNAPVVPSGPKPVLHNPTYLELVHWISDQVESRVPAAERTRWRELVALSREPTWSKKDIASIDAVMPAEVQPSRALARNIPGDATPTMAIAYATCLEKLEQKSVCGKGSRVAAVAAASLLGKEFVLDLDRELARLDAVTIVQRQELALLEPIVETVWRGTSGLKTTHWIVRLGDGTYACIAKMRGRWSVTEGSRDDIIAGLPEAHMDAAVAAVLGTISPERAAQKVSQVALFAPPFPVRELARASAEGAFVASGSDPEERATFSLSTGERTLDSKPAKQRADPRVATWTQGDDSKTVVVTGGAGGRLELDIPKGPITRVQLAGDRVLVAYHGGKRLIVFGSKGEQLGKVDGLELGETVEELIPLACGLVLAFAPWPRGTVFVLDTDGHALATFKLGRFYSDGFGAVLDAGDRVVFTHHHPTSGARLIVIGIDGARELTR